MHVIDLILKKRNGGTLSADEIKFLVDNYTNGNIKDYQMSAFLMTLYYQKMSDEESTYLALAMRDSGDIFNLDSIEGIKVDKHSTGGVGDKVTLILAPLLAAHGAKVAKMSGRGLGHTGGTVDKLESIPGFKTELSFNEFLKQVNEIGVSVIGQSGKVAPADKKLYALRDVTGTVDIIPLIASSIMSKKLASGSDVICLDVKVGSGAFMKTLADAKKLAKLMVKIGKLANKKVSAILTSMDEPLGNKIGNGVEIYESIEIMNGKGPKDVIEVTTTIAATLLVDAGLESDFNKAKIKLEESLKNGVALKKFKEMVKFQGGDISYIDNPEKLLADYRCEIKASSEGFIEKINALEIGLAASRLGAGRETIDDEIDLQVGIDLHKKIGDEVKKGDNIATLHFNNIDESVEEAVILVEKAFKIGNQKNNVKLILDKM